ncbi:TonB-dependent siderophore receptor [Burkholderia sp. 22PA0106]|uniref:TonB-dependent siderophore receptor n=1 Tax=Burkholderia sp. 22PA0106 TaxID=3237371 RepID=UPI0039C23C37
MRSAVLGLLLTLATGAMSGQARAEALAAPDAQAFRADSTQPHRFEIPAGPLASSLNRLAEQADVLLSVRGEYTAGKTSRALHGVYSIDAAFLALLDGSGLEAVRHDDGSYSLRPAPVADLRGALPPVDVRGASPADSIVAPYEGGQVAQGAALGMLGNRDFMDTPFSLTGYTEQLLRDEQSTSVADLLSTTDPSVRAAIDGGNRYDALTIRGLRMENSEIALNGLYGLVPNYRIGTDPVQRIELLRGPGAMLNGMLPQGSVGGSVNVVTKRADDAPLTRLTAEAASGGLAGGHADLGRRFGQDGAFGVRINAAFREGDTPIDEQSRRNAAFSAGLDYRGRRLRLSGDLVYQDDTMRGAARGYTPIAGIALPDAPDPRINLAQPQSYSTSHSLTTMGRAEYDLAPGTTLFGAVGVNRFGYDKLEDPGATLVDARGDAVATTKYQDGRSQTMSAQAGARTRVRTGPVEHRLVLAGNYQQQTTWLGQATYGSYATNIYLPTRLSSLGDPVSASPQARNSTQILRSVAVADTLSVANGLVQLTLGLRRQQIASANFATSGAETARYASGATTPSAALLIRPLDQLAFYANYIEALTPGPTPPSDAANRDQVFSPFRSKQVEFGSKLDLGHFGATLALFQIDVPSGVVDPVTKLYGMNGLQRNRGVELSGFGRIAPGLRVLGGVSWLDAMLRETRGGANDGNRAVGAPALQANLGAEWDVPFVPGFTLTSRLIYTGKAYVSQDNTQHVPAWTRVDLGGRYATRLSGHALTIRANVGNLFDRRYWQANPTGYLINGMPRTVWLSVSTDL